MLVVEEDDVVEFVNNWVKEREPAVVEKAPPPRARDYDDKPDLLPDVLIVKKSKTSTRRFKSTEDVIHVYTDEIDWPGRNVEKREEYDEYCRLWREFTDILVCVRGRKTVVQLEIEIGDLKRMQARLKAIEGKTSFKKRQERETLKMAISSRPTVKALEEEKTQREAMLKEADAIIEELIKNTYVRGRNHDNDRNLKEYKYALHGMLMGQ